METRPLAACPTATGKLQGTTKLQAEIKVSLLDDGEVTQRVTIHLKGETKVEAQVGEDAKLDHMKIDDTQKVDEYVPALIRGIFGPMSAHLMAHRTAGVNLRTGAYQPGESHVEVDAHLGGLVGIFLGGRFREGAGNRMKQESEKLFAATIQRAIEALREREAAWQEANRCAELQFNPASGSLRLAKDASGDFTGQVTAKADGEAATGRWTKTGQQYATVTPDTAAGKGPSFHYTVTDAGPGKKVTASFRVTSPAGVAAGNWTQDTEGEFLYLGEVSGTSQWDQGPCPDATHESLGYSAKLEKSTHTGGPQQPFPLVDDTTVANPGVGLAAWGNDETGTGSFTRDPCPDDGDPGCTTQLQPDTEHGHGHVIFAVEGSTVKATARTWSWKSIDQTDCFLESGVPVFAVGTFPLSEVGAQEITVPLSLVVHNSEDGYTSDFVGSGTLKLHRVQ